MNRRVGVPVLVLLVVTACLAALTGPQASAAVAAPAPGPLTTFAGGLGAGRATNVAQSPQAITARDGRLISVDGGFELPPMGGDTARPGLVRALDLATGIQTVLAGIYTGGFSGDGGPATTAQLNLPTDAAIDAAGNVYITDTGNNRVRKVAPTGTITTFAGNGVAGFSGDGKPASAASVNAPAGIAVSPSGDVAFADRRNYRIRVVSPSGTITTVAGTGESTGPTGDGGPATAAILAPAALEFDAGGNLYVTDTAHGSLRRIQLDGTITTVSTRSSSSISIDREATGHMYLDALPGVVRVDPSGVLTTVAGTERIREYGEDNGDGGLATDAHVYAGDLAFDRGNLYFAEPTTSLIRRVDPAGIVTTVAGNGRPDVSGDGGQARDARFRDTTRIRSGPTGTYVYSSYFGDVRRIDPSGEVSTVYRGKFVAMAVDDAGNLFLVGGNQVRRVTPSGASSIVAGTGESGSTGDGGPARSARLAGPRAIAVDGAGNVYVGGTGSIRRVDALGIITTYVGGSTDPHHAPITLANDTFVGEVWDLAVDKAGSLYWTEWGGLQRPWVEVHKLSCGVARPLTRLLERGGYELAVDAAGSAYFVEGNQVRRFTADGAQSTVAGSGGALPLDGVAATSARLAQAHGVAIHPSGRLLVGDALRIYDVGGVTAGRAVPGPACDSPPDRPVWGTGYNGSGQLGDGTTIDHSGPESENSPLTGVTAVSGGYLHSLALRSDRTVWAWGMNAYGQLGDGTTVRRLTPVQVPGLTDVVAVAAGALHSLALKSDGSVWAWGWNGYGQLGDGTRVLRLRPVRVPGLTGITAVSAGYYHNLALRSDGSVSAWGWNVVGQLGDGSVGDRLLPRPVAWIRGATAVSAGALHSLAVASDGSVWGWGWNGYGQLGDGTVVERHVPTRVVGVAEIRALSAGAYHSLALGQDGTVTAWGLGHVGQVDGSTISRATPIRLPTVAGVVAIAAGAFHSVALGADGRVVGWGWNAYGQLAAEGSVPNLIPQRLAVVDHATAIGAGGYHTLTAHRFGS